MVISTSADVSRHFRALQGRASFNASTVDNSASPGPEMAGEINSDALSEVDAGGDSSVLETPRITGHRRAYSPWKYLDAAAEVIRSGCRSDAVDISESTPTYDLDIQSLDLSPRHISNHLPSVDIIRHLVEIADFHLNYLLCFFDLPKIIDRLNSGPLHFPENDLTTSQVQLLVLIALGRLFREKESSESRPPGHREFLLADRALPSHLILLQDPVTAVETLCLLSYYAQAVHMLDVAATYVGFIFTKRGELRAHADISMV